MLSLVKTQVDNWISAGTLKSYINTAKTILTQAYYPYIEDMWVADLLNDVNGFHVWTYNSRMSSCSSNLALAAGRLDSALDDARDAIGMIDDLLDLAWTQKARPALFIFAFSSYTNEMSIGVIYGCTRGTDTPLFGLRGTVPLTFQDEKVKNLLSTEAICGD